MEKITWEEIPSRIVKKRLAIATSQGKLLPILDYCGGINYEAVKKGFTLRHVFILRWIFRPYVKNKTNEEVLLAANSFLEAQVHLNNIFEDLERRIADKKNLGMY